MDRLKFAENRFNRRTKPIANKWVHMNHMVRGMCMTPGSSGSVRKREVFRRDKSRTYRNHRA